MTTIEVKGVEVPALGYGTWQVTGQAARDGVREALEIGLVLAVVMVDSSNRE